MNRLDIQDLRQKGKNPTFCQEVSTDFFDEIIGLLLNREHRTDLEIIDLIATISNILLINRDLHNTYFIPNYAVQTIDFLDNFINSTFSKCDTPMRYDFNRLVPIYRVIFLTLYNELDNIDAETIAGIYSLLIFGFEFCFSVFATYKEDNIYQMAFIEILKGLYTFQHKHAYGEQVNKENRLINEGILHSCIVTTNNMMEWKNDLSLLLDNELLLTKYLLNSIVGLFTHERNVNKFRIKNTETNASFIHTLTILLKIQLERYSVKKNTDFELTDLINILIIINFISKRIRIQYNETDSQDESFLLPLRSILNEKILPVNDEKFIFNKLTSLILTSNNNIIASNITITDMNIFSNIKNLVLECIYSLSWDPEISRDEQMVRFLTFVGYQNSKEFIFVNNLHLLSDIDTDQYRFPDSKYLDANTQNIIDEFSKMTLDSIFTKEKAGNNINNLSMKEKEVEAEKLFVLFDRMEKLDSFQGFTNPVREWQQLGKFENVRDDND